MRPAIETRKSVFANGFRFWHSLHVTAIDDDSPLSISIENIKAAIHNHPHLPKGLDLKEEHGCAVARGTSTWNTSYGPCELPSFERQLDFTVCSRRPKHIHLKSSSRPLQVGEDADHSGHLTVLFFAWAYLLSARWSEVMPGGRISFTERATDHAGLDSIHYVPKEEDEKETSNEALRWWAAILDPGGGWEATIAVGRNKYSSPWSASIHTTANAYALPPLMSSLIRLGLHRRSAPLSNTSWTIALPMGSPIYAT